MWCKKKTFQKWLIMQIIRMPLGSTQIHQSFVQWLRSSFSQFPLLHLHLVQISNIPAAFYVGSSAEAGHAELGWESIAGIASSFDSAVYASGQPVSEVQFSLFCFAAGNAQMWFDRGQSNGPEVQGVCSCPRWSEANGQGRKDRTL